MNSLDQNESLAWLLSYLPSRVSGTPFYFQQAPDGQLPPFGILNLNRTKPVYSANGVRFWSEDVWSIYVTVAGGAMDALAALSDQLAAALERKSNLVTPGGARMVATQFQGAYYPPPAQEPGGSILYRSAGGLWRVITAVP